MVSRESGAKAGGARAGAGAGSRGCSWRSWSWGHPNDGVGSWHQELKAQEHGVRAWPHPSLTSPASQGVEWKGEGERKGGRAGANWNEVPFAGSYRPRLRSVSGPEAGVGQELKGEAGGGWEGSEGLPVAEDVGVGMAGVGQKTWSRHGSETGLAPAEDSESVMWLGQGAGAGSLETLKLKAALGVHLASQSSRWIGPTSRGPPQKAGKELGAG